MLLFAVVTTICGQRICPEQCACPLDPKGLIQVICNKGGMTLIPVDQMDPNTEVLIIRGPRNHMSVGPVFQNKNIFKLEIIRITDSNVPSVGTYSFWGLDKLRILGKISSKDSKKQKKLIRLAFIDWNFFLN